jgi:hypothetical protein
MRARMHQTVVRGSEGYAVPVQWECRPERGRSVRDKEVGLSLSRCVERTPDTQRSGSARLRAQIACTVPHAATRVIRGLSGTTLVVRPLVQLFCRNELRCFKKRRPTIGSLRHNASPNHLSMGHRWCIRMLHPPRSRNCRTFLGQ